MKSTLEFDLLEEREELNDALNGTKYRLVVEATLNLIRHKLEHDCLVEYQDKLLEEIRDFINEEIE